MNILWHSNAPWAGTGYGQQTGLFTPLLADHHNVTVSAFYGLEGAPLQLNDKIKVLPGRGGTFGNESILGHAHGAFEGDLRNGLALTLMDVWVLDAKLWSKMNVLSWVPVDHDPAPPAVKAFFQHSGAVPLAMSRFGEKMLAEFNPLYCPHAVDCRVYGPVDDARKIIGLPESAFIVGVVAANKGWGRKCLPEMIEAFARFRERHDDAILYLHTEMSGHDQGVNLENLIRSLNIPDKALIISDQYRYQYNPLPPQMLTTLYSAFDVLLATSRGEGFGLTVLEAQAAGTPAIVTDFSAQPEVCGSGWHVEGEREWQQQQSWQMKPSLEDTLDALEQAYRQPEAAKKQMRNKARAHAETYHVETVVEKYMLPAIDKAWERFEDRAPIKVAA